MMEALISKACHELVCYETLETLGDAFLKFAVSVHLYRLFPRAHEGNFSGSFTHCPVQHPPACAHVQLPCSPSECCYQTSFTPIMSSRRQALRRRQTSTCKQALAHRSVGYPEVCHQNCSDQGDDRQPALPHPIWIIAKISSLLSVELSVEGCMREGHVQAAPSGVIMMAKRGSAKAGNMPEIKAIQFSSCTKICKKQMHFCPNCEPYTQGSNMRSVRNAPDQCEWTFLHGVDRSGGSCRAAHIA